MSDCVYLVVTDDRYELPVGIFESQLSIAKTYGVSREAVSMAVKRRRKFQRNYRIICVDMSTIPESYVTIEGVFGILKQDYNFRRFLVRGKKQIETQFFLLAFAFNVEKWENKRKNHRFGRDLFPLKAG